MAELTKRAKPEGGDLRSSLALHGILLLTGLSFTVQWIYTGSAVDICQFIRLLVSFVGRYSAVALSSSFFLAHSQ